MKKWILLVAFILAINGFAAAQNTGAKDSTRTEKSPAKKVTTDKKTLKTPIKKQEDARETVALIKLKVILPEVDTTGVPVNRKQ